MTRSQSDAVALTGSALVAEVLQRFGEARVRVLGTSMLPSIGPRDVLLVRRCPIERAAVGDIVLFAIGVRLFAHRVVEIGANSAAPHLITKGDAHRVADAPVSPHQLLGQVVAVSREDRYARLFASVRRSAGSLIKRYA
jgi:signal peptidase I